MKPQKRPFRKIIIPASLACLLSLALAFPAHTADRETGRPRGFGFVEMPDGGESVLLGCKSEPYLLTEDELGDAVAALVAQTGTWPKFIGFRPYFMPIEEVFRIDGGKIQLVDCEWRTPA